MKNAISIWLDVDIKTLSRIKWNQKRPLLKKENNQKKLTEIYMKERKNIYKLADHKIVCDKLSKKILQKK